MFAYNSTTGQWELTGIMFSVGLYSGQPTSSGAISTAVYGDATYCFDLSQYYDQIQSIIVPEPMTLCMLSAGAMAMLRRRRKTCTR